MSGLVVETAASKTSPPGGPSNDHAPSPDTRRETRGRGSGVGRALGVGVGRGVTVGVTVGVTLGVGVIVAVGVGVGVGVGSPPFVVRRIVPESPTAMPVEPSLTNETSFKL